jgi:hypothetical protein
MNPSMPFAIPFAFTCESASTYDRLGSPEGELALYLASKEPIVWKIYANTFFKSESKEVKQAKDHWQEQ